MAVQHSGNRYPSLVCIKAVSGTAPHAVKSNSTAPPAARRLYTPPRLHQTPPLNPHANRETYSGHTSVHERVGIKRNTGRAPPVRPQFKRGHTLAKLLPSALYLHEARQTAGKNRTPPPLPHLRLHQFLHSFDGFRGAVLRHITRLGGPPSPPDTGEAAWCFINVAWPDGASCRPNPARGSATRHSNSAQWIGHSRCCSMSVWQ